MVIAALVATSAPLMNSFPVSPDRVTAMCDQVFTGNAAVWLMVSSLPPFLIAKRATPPPDFGVRNRYCVVPLPISRMRCQLLPPPQ